MEYFEAHPDMETDQLYIVGNPTDIHASIKLMCSISIIISTITIIMNLHLMYLIQSLRNQIMELEESYRKEVKSIVDIICRKNKQKTDIKNAVSEAVRLNIHLIESDLMVSESSLIDELQNGAFLSDEETKSMTLRNRSDQAHLFAEILEVMDDRNFLRIVDMLKRCSFEHIARSLQSSYENIRNTELLAISGNAICPICRLRYEVDIKDLRCELKMKELLPFRLYVDINTCLAGKGHQDYLWKRLFIHLKSFENDSVENEFIKIFDKPRHQGLYECFVQKFPTHFECFCECMSLF